MAGLESSYSCQFVVSVFFFNIIFYHLLVCFQNFWMIFPNERLDVKSKFSSLRESRRQEDPEILFKYGQIESK